jgi:signal transduction histidine kinase
MPNPAINTHSILVKSKYLPVVVIGLALFILGGTIFFASFDLRRKSRAQLILQQAQVLYELWTREELTDETESDLGVTERASDQLLTVLQTARLPQVGGLYGNRLFDRDGKYIFADPTIAKLAALPPEDVAMLNKLEPVAHFRPKANLNEVIILEPKADLSEVINSLTDTQPRVGPLLEICIPLHAAKQDRLLGIAQFILKGDKVEAAFRTLDRNLFHQAVLSFLAGGGLLVLLLGVSFWELLRLNRFLADRTQSLLRANQELALAAKTSAVGAVTAHLIHGLKNPLSGLQSFMASRGTNSDGADDRDWELAVTSTRRMQTMISEIVRVLRDEQGSSAYELSIQEFTQGLAGKVGPLAREAGIQFASHVTAEAVLNNREANLISLILFNLIQNAIQATPPGGAVTLRIGSERGSVVCEVADQGPGISAEQQRALFQPCHSSKQGGSGVGLAISKQLANCVAADLQLKETGPAGSVFVLSFTAESQASSATLRTLAADSPLT